MATPPHEAEPGGIPSRVVSSTHPLAPTRAAQIQLDEFIEVALSAALRAVEAPSESSEQVALNPQPLPPRSLRPIIIGIILDPQIMSE
jgi:hypothetical protein